MKTYKLERASTQLCDGRQEQPHPKAYAKEWYIDINSLEELEELEVRGENTSGIIISKSCITIYDDWVE